MNFNFFKSNKDNILNENIIFNYVKKIPLPYNLDFEYPNNHDDRLKGICSNVATGVAVKCRDLQEFQKASLTLDMKRARAKDLEDYRSNLYKNILYPLFNYANFLNSFDLILNKDYNTYKINTEKLWLLVTENNSSNIKNNWNKVIKENHFALELLQKYKQKTIDDLEYDYVIATILSESAHAILDTFLNKDNENLFNELKRYNYKDVKYLLNNDIMTFTSFMYKQTLG